MAMAGWGTLTGEANYTYGAIIHSNDPAKRLGSFNFPRYSNAEADKIIEQSSVELDDTKRNALLAEVGALVANERPRLPIAAVASAWAMQRDKVTIRPRVDEDTLAMKVRPVQR
jgi:peptide/nickel transport system substrate-binding protein